MSRCLALLLFCSTSLAHAAMNHSFELAPDALDGFGPVTARSRATKEAPEINKRPGGARYRHVARTGNQRGRHRRHTLKKENGKAISGGTAMAFHLDAAAPLASDQKAARIEALWKDLVPRGAGGRETLSLRNSVFSLALDPRRYPVFHAMDGARILMDQDSSLPPLVKALLMQQEPSLRYVSGSPANSKRFLSSLLAAGGFYSVVEDAVLDFGDDPNLQVRFDHKIEQTADSLVKQEVVLINDDFHPLPPQLTAHLRKAGFIVYEPFAVPGSLPAHGEKGSLCRISATNRMEILDALLDALGIRYHGEQRIDLFTGDNRGVSLSVTAQRTYEYNGDRYLAVSFDGNPITYTLLRLLETRGYKVITLEEEDDFRAVSEKLLASLRIPANYGKHDMWPANDVNYSLRMSGFSLRGAGIPGGSLFLTDLQVDPLAHELLTIEGYNVRIK